MEKLKMDYERSQSGFEKCFRSDLAVLEHCGTRQWARHPTLQTVDEIVACTKATYKKVHSANPHVDEICMVGSPLAPACLESSDSQLCSSHPAQYGMYALEVMEYLEAFPAEQVKVVRSEDFYADTVAAMEDMQHFLHLADFDWVEATKKAYNIVNPKSVTGSKADLITNDKNSNKGLQMGASATSDYPPLAPDVRARLEQAMEPYNRALAEMLGREEFRWKA